MKKILAIMAFIAGTVLNAAAQTADGDFVYLIKGDKVVAKYSVGDVDYVSFRLPEGVQESPIDIKADITGKNFVTYTVNTINPTVSYVHCVVLESFVDYLLQEYFNSNLSSATPELMESALWTCMHAYGFEGMGTNTYTLNDGWTDGSTTMEILAGQRYFVCAWETDSEYNLTGSPYYTTATTQAADESTAELKVGYDGLNDKGEAMFNFTISSDIVRVRTMYGLKSVLAPYIEQYGYDYTLFTFGDVYQPDELTAGTVTWTVADEDDYVMYALGIDNNGDWVKAQAEAHIVPPARQEQGPKINLLDKSKGDGKVSVKFEITPSNVSEAYVRLMNEEDADDRLNTGYTLADLARGGDATDITATINNFGEYTYTNDALSRGWYSLIIMGTNGDGTTVTRINFHSHLEDAEWDLHENVSTPSSAKLHAPKPAPAIKAGRIGRRLK